MNLNQSRLVAHLYCSPISAIACLFILICFGAAPVVANPLVGDAVFTHVQVSDPQFCSANSITDCTMIDQYSNESGLLDFALFFQPIEHVPEQIQQLFVELRWPEGWQFSSTEACLGEVEMTLLDNGVYLTFTFAEGDANMDSFFLAGKITMNVAERGYLDNVDVFYSTYEGGEYGGMGFSARAGYDCGDCSHPCNLEDICWPLFDDSDVYLTASEGETAVFEFTGSAGGMSPLCDIAFNTEFDWISLDVVEVEYLNYNVTVTADAAELTPGIYEGWVNGSTPSCYLCRYVIFEVLSLSPIEARTWGRIKTDYR
jgi:hypothetical protein